MIQDKSEVIKQEEERGYRWKWRWNVPSLHGLDLDFFSSFPPPWSLHSPSFIHLISSYFSIPDTNKTMMKNEHHADECNDYLNAAFHYDYYWLELLDRIERRREKRCGEERRKTRGKFGKRIESMRLIKGILIDIIHIVCVGSFFSLVIISDFEPIFLPEMERKFSYREWNTISKHPWKRERFDESNQEERTEYDELIETFSLSLRRRSKRERGREEIAMKETLDWNEGVSITSSTFPLSI